MAKENCNKCGKQVGLTWQLTTAGGAKLITVTAGRSRGKRYCKPCALKLNELRQS